MNTLIEKTASPASRRATRSSVHTTTNLDALWGELEALTRSDELVRFQCPECESLVDGSATRCTCGAIFEDLTDEVGYACPLCGTRVASDAVRCRCGAWFSD
jgi:predicted RNA-binding Zn-ribbon protein involved in translation (DUF1610 family)